ncbi:MAG: tyrosine--tRNA ligase, partial [Patescibacteria group bacterium]
MSDVDELLTRGVDKIYPSKEALEKALKSGKKLRLYQGFDPTGTQLHIGHMVGLRKLSQWQKAGHHVIFLIGDGTGQAGDPSGKTSSRHKYLTRDELRENAKDYVMQAKKIINFDAPNVEILYNGDWLNKLTLVDVLDLMKHFSLGQLSERDLFVERKKKGEEVGLREAFYPVLQAYDSVAMDVDLEIGGTDQTFNMLAGRKLVREMQGRDKFVMTTPLLTDSQGNKIGKTEGNVIAFTDKPSDLYRKIMALGDDVIVKGFEYLTDVSMEEVKEIEQKLEKGENPILYKKKLAFEVTKQLNNEGDARKAEEEFERVVQKGELPSEVAETEIE